MGVACKQNDNDIVQRILFVPLSRFHGEQIKEVFMRNYVDTEPLYRLLDFDKASVEATFQSVFMRAIVDECSCVAIDWQTNQVVAACIAICNEKLRATQTTSAKCQPRTKQQLTDEGHSVEGIYELLREKAQLKLEKENYQTLELENSIEVMFIFTEKDYRGRGIQSQLLHHVIDSARRGNMHSVVCVAKAPCTQKLLCKVGFSTVCCASFAHSTEGHLQTSNVSTTEIRCCWMCLNLSSDDI